jgi:hypothetical protein
VVPENDPIPGAVIAVQTFGDFLGFNSHCDIILVTDACQFNRTCNESFGKQSSSSSCILPPTQIGNLDQNAGFQNVIIDVIPSEDMI